jgi:hypothetical protein
MEVTVVKLTETVVVQTVPTSRPAYVAVTLLKIVVTGRVTVVMVLHTALDPSWRFKPWGGCNHSAASGKCSTRKFSNRMLL